MNRFEKIQKFETDLLQTLNLGTIWWEVNSTKVVRCLQNPKKRDLLEQRKALYSYIIAKLIFVRKNYPKKMLEAMK